MVFPSSIDPRCGDNPFPHPYRSAMRRHPVSMRRVVSSLALYSTVLDLSTTCAGATELFHPKDKGIAHIPLKQKHLHHLVAEGYHHVQDHFGRRVSFLQLADRRSETGHWAGEGDVLGDGGTSLGGESQRTTTTPSEDARNSGRGGGHDHNVEERYSRTRPALSGRFPDDWSDDASVAEGITFDDRGEGRNQGQALGGSGIAALVNGYDVQYTASLGVGTAAVPKHLCQ